MVLIQRRKEDQSVGSVVEKSDAVSSDGRPLQDRVREVLKNYLQHICEEVSAERLHLQHRRCALWHSPVSWNPSLHAGKCCDKLGIESRQFIHHLSLQRTHTHSPMFQLGRRKTISEEDKWQPAGDRNHRNSESERDNMSK